MSLIITNTVFNLLENSEGVVSTPLGVRLVLGAQLISRWNKNNTNYAQICLNGPFTAIKKRMRKTAIYVNKFLHKNADGGGNHPLLSSSTVNRTILR